MDSTKKTNIYAITAVALMAAFVYVATNIRIELATPVGRTMIHFGNIFCLLSGLLLGPKRGGAAAGIGSMLFDLLNGWASSAPTTLVFKFMMAFVCGKIAYSSKREAKVFTFNLIGAAIGSMTYTALYIGNNFFESYILNRLELQAVLLSLATKLAASLTNGVTAVIFAMILLPVFSQVLKKSGMGRKLASA